MITEMEKAEIQYLHLKVMHQECTLACVYMSD